MKLKVLYLCSFSGLFSFHGILCSQNKSFDLHFEEDQTDTMEVDSACAALFFDGGCFVMPVRDMLVNGMSLQLGGTREHVAFGLVFDLICSDKVFFPSDLDFPSPRYTYLFFGWDNEYICNPSKRVNISFHTKLGFGYTEYSSSTGSEEIMYYEIDDSTSYFTPVYSYYSGLIASETFFSMEPGMKVLFNISDWLGVGAGWNSRIVLGINKESPLRNDSFYAGRLFVRVALRGKRH